MARGHPNYHHIPMPCWNVNYHAMAQGPVQDPARQQTGSQNHEWLVAPPAAAKLLVVVETVFIWNKGGGGTRGSDLRKIGSRDDFVARRESQA